MTTTCPGCGLEMPARPDAPPDGYYNTTRECWSVFTEVVGAEFANALLFGRAHQLTVDTYAVQHAGGPHPDNSPALCAAPRVDVHRRAALRAAAGSVVKDDLRRRGCGRRRRGVRRDVAGRN